VTASGGRKKSRPKIIICKASLAATMVRWSEGGVNQGLLPMTISEEKCNLFRAMLNHRFLVHSKWCKTEKTEKSEPSRVSNPGR
jgi:hypothetical protein